MSSAKTGSGKTKSAGSRSYYSDEYTDYSDSFVSEDDDLPPLKKAGKTILAKKTASVAASNKKSTAGTVRGRNTKNATRNASKATTTPRVDYVAKRMLSARRLKINELRNENENLAQQVNDLKHENKYLKRTQHRQEKALERFEDQDSELPRLIEQHSEEVRSLKEQIRKYKDKLNRSDRRKREIEDELAKTTKDLKKLNVIASDKKLAEREELSKKLSKTEINLEEKEHKCQELSRHVENLQKNHRRELATEVSKHRDLQRENAELKQELERALGQVKEKEKELDIKNIYSNRVLKPPHKLPTSTHSSPTPSPPSKPTKKQKKNSPDISPREKAKLMEEKRREDERRKREEKLRREERDRKTIEPPSMDWDNFSLSQDKGQERREQEERERREREEHERRDRLEQERRDRESRLRREEEERKRREWEEEEISLKNERNRMKREAEERQRREEEERERQERDRQEREDRERRDQEEREERERREREERDGRERREREDRERRAREEADRLANDTKSQEERRKKDLLLQRMKQIDDTKSKGDPIDISPITKKPVKETSDFSPSADRKQYTFPKPVQNLHNGLPSHDDDIDKKNKKRNFIFDDDDLEGGYNPSFTQTTKNQSPKGRRIQRGNRSNLMESLFGDEGPKPKSSFGEDDIFSSATKAKPVSDRKSLPWGNDSKTNNNNDSLGSPLFGESTNTNNKLLPRRQRQDVSAFHAKPTVNAVDDFDDDIEEVVL